MSKPIPSKREAFGEPPIPVHNSGAGRANFPHIAKPVQFANTGQYADFRAAQAARARKLPKLGG